MAVILCVDVGPAVAAILENILRDLNHDPVHVRTVDEAILALHDRPFDLAILDTDAPHRDGYPFLDHLRDREISMPTIVVADFSSTDHPMAALSRGAADYLTKPLRAESVRIAVTNALEIDRLRRATSEFRRDVASFDSNGEVLNLRELEAIAIRRALKKTGGHRIKAAELLGINERTLRNKLKLDEFKDSVPPRPSNGSPRR